MKIHVNDNKFIEQHHISICQQNSFLWSQNVLQNKQW